MIVTDPTGTDLEVRQGTPAHTVADALGLAELWCGTVRLDDAHPAGVPPFLHGARLGTGPGEAWLAPPGPWLEVVRGPDAGGLAPLVPTGVEVGRADDSALRIDDPAISARHARVVPEGRRRVRDLGSANGSHLDRASGDIRIGRTVIATRGDTSTAVSADGRSPVASRGSGAARPALPWAAAGTSLAMGVGLAAMTGRWWLLAIAIVPAALILIPRLAARGTSRSAPSAAAPRTPRGTLAVRGDAVWVAGYLRAVALDRGARLEGMTAEPWMRWLGPPGPGDRVATVARGAEPPTWCETVVDVGPTGTVATRGSQRTQDRPLAVGASRADDAARRWAGALADEALPRRVRWADLAPAADQVAPAAHPVAPAADDAAAATEASPGVPRRLEALLGQGEHGTVTVDLDRDGPHLLVAGTTGAGKSVALETLIAALAWHHSPVDLAIALIDFKGGAGLGRCVPLPHVCGTVTDLDGKQARRALAGIAAELRSRKASLSERSLVSWHEWEGQGDAPPRLLVVIDEYQEVASVDPDFVPEVARLAAQGRSLGLHLVLATQRPAGAVTPAVRANVGATLALRVASESESRDLIGAPAAASIPRDAPGRAILQRQGELTAVQVADASATPSPALWPVGAAPGEGRRLVDAARQRWAATAPAARLWLPLLPSHWVAPRGLPGTPFVVGLADSPTHRRQSHVEWRPEEGALVLAGARGPVRDDILAALAGQARDRDLVPVSLPRDAREAARTLALAHRRTDVLLVVPDVELAQATLGGTDDGTAWDALAERCASGKPTVLACGPTAPARLTRQAAVTIVYGAVGQAGALWSVPPTVIDSDPPGRARVVNLEAEVQLAASQGHQRWSTLVAPLPRECPAGTWGVAGDGALACDPPPGKIAVCGSPTAARAAIAASCGPDTVEVDVPTLAPTGTILVLTEPTPRQVRTLAPEDWAGVVDPVPLAGRVVVIDQRRAVAVQLSLDLRVVPGIGDDGGRGDHRDGHHGDSQSNA